MLKIRRPLLRDLYIHFHHAEKVSFQHAFKNGIFCDLSLVVSKESRALSVNEVVDFGILTTVLSKLALPHFDDIVLLFQIGSGLLRALVLGSSGGSPLLVSDASRVVTQMPCQ